MKTTIDIPDDLLGRVRKASGTKTKRDAVLAAMNDYDRRKRVERFLATFKRSDTFMTFEELMEMRELDMPKTVGGSRGKKGSH